MNTFTIYEIIFFYSILSLVINLLQYLQMVSGLNGLIGILVLKHVEGAIKHAQEIALIRHQPMVAMIVVQMTLKCKFAMKKHVLLVT